MIPGSVGLPGPKIKSRHLVLFGFSGGAGIRYRSRIVCADKVLREATRRKATGAGPNQLLHFRDQGIVLVDPDGKNEKKLTEKSETYYGEARLSPDGKMITVLVRSGEGAAQKQTLYVRALDEKEPGTDLGVGCDTFVWSPDGSEIACAEFAVGVGPGTFSSGHFVLDVKTRQKKALKLPDDHLINDWSADGRFFLTTHFVMDKEKSDIAGPRPRRGPDIFRHRDSAHARPLVGVPEPEFGAAGGDELAVRRHRDPMGGSRTGGRPGGRRHPPGAAARRRQRAAPPPGCVGARETARTTGG